MRTQLYKPRRGRYHLTRGGDGTPEKPDRRRPLCRCRADWASRYVYDSIERVNCSNCVRSLANAVAAALIDFSRATGGDLHRADLVRRDREVAIVGNAWSVLFDWFDLEICRDWFAERGDRVTCRLVDLYEGLHRLPLLEGRPLLEVLDGRGSAAGRRSPVSYFCKF